MKKSKLILSILSIPTMSMVLLPLVSCGDKDKPITPTVTKDKHIRNVECTTITKNNSFTITVTFIGGMIDPGWAKIDQNNSSIKIGGNKLSAGTDFDFVGDNKIEVKGTAVNGNAVDIDIKAAATSYIISTDIKNRVMPEDELEIYHIGETLKTDDLIVKSTKGDKTKTVLSPAAEPSEANRGNYQIYYHLDETTKEITTDLIGNGYKFTEQQDMRSSGLPTSSRLYSYCWFDDVDKDEYEQIPYVVCKPIETFDIIGSEKTTASTEESIKYEVSVNKGAWEYADIQITKTTPETPGETMDAVITSSGLYTGTIKGTVEITATTKDKKSLAKGKGTKTWTVTIS